jgi:cytochrome c biogenesis protein CcmG/thiol:disulfide interchange protein DsbE
VSIRAALAVSVTLLAASCSRSDRQVRAESLKPEGQRKIAPDFSLKDSGGKTVKLSDYRGKVVLLNFWATWCGPCKMEIPWFIEFEQKHKDQGFSILGVAMDDGGWDDVKPYIERRKVNYRVLMGNDSVSEMYGGIDSLPTTFLLDREGRIASVHIGLVSQSDYQNEINALLQAAPTSTGGARSSAGAAAHAGAE